MNTTLQDLTNPIEMGARLKFAPNELLILESDINYTNLHLVGGERVIVSYHLGKLQKRLQPFCCFVRPNRYTLVNVQYINGIENNCLYVGQKQIVMSRRRREAVLATIASFSQSNSKIF